jgi:hypothetical protein
MIMNVVPFLIDPNPDPDPNPNPSNEWMDTDGNYFLSPIDKYAHDTAGHPIMYGRII